MQVVTQVYKELIFSSHVTVFNKYFCLIRWQTTLKLRSHRSSDGIRTGSQESVLGPKPVVGLSQGSQFFPVNTFHL